MVRVSFAGVILAAALLAQNASDLKTTPGFDLSAIDKTGQPLRRLLSIRLRNLAEEQSHPARPVLMGPIQRTAGAQPRRSCARFSKRPPRPPTRDADTQKIGDYYSSCMDETPSTRKALQPLQPELDRIRAMKNLRDLTAEVGRLHRDRRRRAVQLLFRPGFQRFQRRDRPGRPGRHRAAREGLLLPHRRQSRRNPQGVCGARRAHVAVAGRSRGRRGRTGRHHHAVSKPPSPRFRST